MTQPPYNPQQPGQYHQPGQTTSQYPVGQNTAQYPVTGGFAYPATGSQPSVPPAGPTGPKRRNNTVVVLAVIAVLMLAGAATFGALYFVEKGDHKTTSDQLAGARTDLSNAQKDAQAARTDLQTTKSELETTKTQLNQANQDKISAQNASTKDTACAAAARKALTAVARKDDKAADAAIQEMVNSC